VKIPDVDTDRALMAEARSAIDRAGLAATDEELGQAIRAVAITREGLERLRQGLGRLDYPAAIFSPIATWRSRRAR
jgi:hypothetical protein